MEYTKYSLYEPSTIREVARAFADVNLDSAAHRAIAIRLYEREENKEAE